MSESEVMNSWLATAFMWLDTMIFCSVGNYWEFSVSFKTEQLRGRLIENAFCIINFCCHTFVKQLQVVWKYWKEDILSMCTKISKMYENMNYNNMIKYSKNLLF